MSAHSWTAATERDIPSRMETGENPEDLPEGPADVDLEWDRLPEPDLGEETE